MSANQSNNTQLSEEEVKDFFKYLRESQATSHQVAADAVASSGVPLDHVKKAYEEVVGDPLCATIG